MLTPKQITDIIRSDESLTTLATAQDWAAIVASWPEQRLPDVRVSGRQTAVGLMEAGHNWLEITTAFDATVPGRDLKAIMQSQDGINWADPLTVQTLGILKTDLLNQEVIDSLVRLSRKVAPTPTADEVEAAIATEAARIAAETLESEWVSLQNDGGINAAVAAGDRAGLVAALTAAIEVL